jgi:hypothetical protein
LDTKEFERWQFLGQQRESNRRLLFVFLFSDLCNLNQKTSDEVKRTLNTQISEATGVKLGNFIQSVDDALTLVPHNWSWEPVWQKMLQQLGAPNLNHSAKIVPPGTSPEFLYPLPIAISMTALVVHRTMSRRGEQGLSCTVGGSDNPTHCSNAANKPSKTDDVNPGLTS